MDIQREKRNILIAFGTLSGLGVILAFVRTWKWFGRTGKIIIDLPTIGKFIFNLFGIIGTVLLLVSAGTAIWWLISFKKNYENNFTSEWNEIENMIRIFLIVSFVLKTLNIFHLIAQQAGIDIFFMDWERSKIGDSNSVSVWRTYFVANEYNEIQTFRRISVTFQLFLTLFFLKVINLENISCAENRINLIGSNLNCTEYNSIFRTGIAFGVLLGTSLLQYFAYVLIYQRIISDKIINFIDLCSVLNISVLIFDQNQHGYYLHGRSPHGITDVNMRDLLINFHREETRMSGTRGLQNNSDEQLFVVKINRTFRIQYEMLYRSYNDYKGPRKTREDTERNANILLKSYQDFNSFLCAFIDHSLPDHQYRIRNRLFLEKIFNYEFQTRFESTLIDHPDNILYTDNEKTFTEVLFYGIESSLFIWNAITFLFIDYLSKNYVLAAALTYLINMVAVSLRDSFGRRNLSNKTLIPRNFLI